MRKKLRADFLIFAVFSACFPIFVVHRYLHEELLVDNCLSAKHGSFDYSTITCDLEENHTYVSYHDRHPRDGSVFLIGSVACVLFLSAYGLVRIVPEKP